MKKATAILFSLSLLTLSACDSGGSDGDQQIPSQQGRFQASVSGAVTLDVSGTAFSGTAGGPWALAMTVTSAKTGGYQAISFLRHDLGRPSEGAYTVGTADPESGDFYASATVDNVNYTGSSGSFSVASSSEESVSGTFSITLRAIAGTNPLTVTIVGGFRSTDHLDL